jgi:hypothetical protein
MNKPFLMTFLMAFPLYSVGQTTGNATATGNCNIVISGNNNTVSSAYLQSNQCGLGKEQLDKLIRLLNGTLTKRDAAGINAKLDELLQIAERGQQTTVNAPVNQQNSGECNQQVVGGNNNSVECAPQDRHLTGAQKNMLEQLPESIPAGVQLQVVSPEDSEPGAYADEFIGAINRKKFTIGGHGLLNEGRVHGVRIFIHSDDDPGVPFAQEVKRQLESAGISVARIEKNIWTPAKTVDIFVGFP